MPLTTFYKFTRSGQAALHPEQSASPHCLTPLMLAMDQAAFCTGVTAFAVHVKLDLCSELDKLLIILPRYCCCHTGSMPVSAGQPTTHSCIKSQLSVRHQACAAVVNHYKENECMRLAMEDVLYSNGVDVILNGHCHEYERSNPVYVSPYTDATVVEPALASTLLMPSPLPQFLLV